MKSLELKILLAVYSYLFIYFVCKGIQQEQDIQSYRAVHQIHVYTPLD